MTLDEILGRYEDLWRRAERDGALQWRGGRENSRDGICAALCACSPEDRPVSIAAFNVLEGWACDCQFFADEHGLWAAMVHLNDPPHRWTWTQYVKDFREIYRAGVARWLNGIAA